MSDPPHLHNRLIEIITRHAPASDRIAAVLVHDFLDGIEQAGYDGLHRELLAASVTYPPIDVSLPS